LSENIASFRRWGVQAARQNHRPSHFRIETGM